VIWLFRLSLDECVDRGLPLDPTLFRKELFGREHGLAKGFIVEATPVEEAVRLAFECNQLAGVA
jgi:hypothetical protein